MKMKTIRPCVLIVSLLQNNKKFLSGKTIKWAWDISVSDYHGATIKGNSKMDI